MERGGAVYIMTNQNNTTLYIGVTSGLQARVQEHQNRTYINSFTSRYKLFKLVYYELFHDIEEAIDREKYLKGKSRKFKDELIKEMNPEWKDLWEEVKLW